MSETAKAPKAVAIEETDLDRATGGTVYLNPGDAGDRPNGLILWPSEEVDNLVIQPGSGRNRT